MYALYSLLMAVGMILLSPYFLVRGLIHGKYLDNIPERLGGNFPQSLARMLPGLRTENRSGSMQFQWEKCWRCCRSRRS